MIQSIVYSLLRSSAGVGASGCFDVFAGCVGWSSSERNLALQPKFSSNHRHVSFGRQVCDRANRFFTLSHSQSAEFAVISPKRLFIFPLALSFLFSSFVSFSLSPQMAHGQTHALHHARRICPIGKTLSLGFDDLLWHNLKRLLGLITLSANCDAPHLSESFIFCVQTPNRWTLELNSSH